MRTRRNRITACPGFVVAAALTFVAIVVACDARLSAPREPQSPVASVTTPGTQPVGSRGSKQRDKAYTASVLNEKPALDEVNTCFTATARDSTIQSGHVFDTVQVGRAADSIATPNGTTRYTYIRWKRPSRHVTLMATCVIPTGEAARTAVQTHFRAQARKNEVGVGAEEEALGDQIVEEVEHGAPEADEAATDAGSEDTDAFHHATATAPTTPGLLYMECELLPGYLSCNDFMCDYDWVWERWDCDNDCYGYWIWDDDELEFYIWLECGEELEWSGGTGTSGQPPPSDFALECNSSAGPITVERAQNVSCEATATPNGTITSLTWYFDGNRFDVNGDTLGTSNPLSGPMVDSGTITVSGEINNLTASSAAVVIRVTPRTWSWGNRVRLTDTVAYTCDTSRVWAPNMELGWAIASRSMDSVRACAGDWLLSPHHEVGDGGFPVSQVPGGPNKGLFYVTELRDSLSLQTQLHRDIRPLNAPIMGLPPHLYHVDTTVAAGIADCNRSGDTTLAWVNAVCKSATNWSSFLSHVVAHERCHMTRSAAKFASLDTAVNRFVESVLNTTSAGARNQAFFGLEAANDLIWDYGEALHDLTQTDTVHLWRPTSSTNATWTNIFFVGGPAYNPANCG